MKMAVFGPVFSYETIHMKIRVFFRSNFWRENRNFHMNPCVTRVRIHTCIHENASDQRIVYLYVVSCLSELTMRHYHRHSLLWTTSIILYNYAAAMSGPTLWKFQFEEEMV